MPLPEDSPRSASVSINTPQPVFPPSNFKWDTAPFSTGRLETPKLPDPDMVQDSPYMSSQTMQRERVSSDYRYEGRNGAPASPAPQFGVDEAQDGVGVGPIYPSSTPRLVGLEGIDRV
eukprot:CAMPEP_0206283842 /NCGR_PEP_ID=MMETSP0047_2-20121206/40448_1 /ASSEMBLY_ACC=CAM_ASM_000192 /TAXON_ID=195065 /ORGANISM="Chroomonas mesostigmatica_cf, Strain CCMP1168" /LENGTH=117 /DNA_ID=CAMNT_0053714239 /DNA_START=253 /DNA_END=606 /DNA_ORIENTATION=-